MSNIQIISNGRVHLAESFVFSGGEVQLKIPTLPDVIHDGDLTVVARVQTANTLVELLLACEILKRKYVGRRKRLVIPYFPYARQDRIMVSNEAFSLKVISKLINTLGFDEVVTYDPHSYVTEAMVDNIKPRSQLEIIETECGQLTDFIRKEKPVLISPDAGASKKALSVAKHFNLKLAIGHKTRDVTTGEITGSSISGIEPSDLSGATVLIVDDICDGGRTFVELAKLLKTEYQVHKIILYVTHGIFSQGYDVFKGLIDVIFTTDTFLPKLKPTPEQIPVKTASILYGLEEIK